MVTNVGTLISMSETRPTREGYRLDEADSATVAKRVAKLMESAKPKKKKADLARHLKMHASHVGNLFSENPNSARRWQRWHVVGTAEFLGVDEAELLKDTKIHLDKLGEPEEKPTSRTGSDPSDKLPPNVEDFIRRREHEFAEGELDFFHDAEFRKAWPNLEAADDDRLVKLVKLHTGFALRAAQRRPSR